MRRSGAKVANGANQRDNDNDDKGKISKEEAGRKGGEARSRQRDND